MNAQSREFHIFKNNTEATATNKGFYFQYLCTLKLWLSNYNNQSFEIYCETEDDIKSVDTSTNTIHYSQIKCYSSDFALSSPEVVKSLFNFYNLFLKYKKNYGGTFLFSTNASIKPRAGKILSSWLAKQKAGDYDVTDFVKPVREILIYHATEQESVFSTTSNNKLAKAQANSELNDFKNNVNSLEFIGFIKRLRWEFTQDGEDAIRNIIDEITLLLSKTDYNKNVASEIVIAYLLHAIIKKSSEKEEKSRRLSHAELSKLILDTKSNSALIDTIEKNIIHIVTDFYKISKNIDSIKENTNNILTIVTGQQNSITPLNAFNKTLKQWLVAIGHSVTDINNNELDSFIFIIKIVERRKITNVLVYGIIKPINVQDVHKLDKLRTHYDCDESWIVSTSYATPAVLQLTDYNRTGNVLCYNFDELIEETIDFTNYFTWVEHEVNQRKISERYLQLAAKKGEFDSRTKEVVASSIYGEKEGWLEGYINSWVHDNQKEHVSILGEFGTGKTWFTLYYTWQQIKKYNEAKAKHLPRPRIPILIPLRDFSKALQVDVLISDFFFRKHQIEIKGSFSAFHYLNQTGKILFIFDGFDEMAEKTDKQKLIDNFWELASVIKGDSKVILTCRNEHFANINEGRDLLNAEYRESTKEISDDSPRFEVVELLKFDHKQIRKILSFVTNTETIDIIFGNERIIELLSRPIMVELIVDAISEIESQKAIDIASIYFYATKRKMERDISQKRTFTSLCDKMFFMQELAWYMLANDKLTISYKEFPEIIYLHFSSKAIDKELDYWRSDMRSQSMLIIDDEGGNYKPAHKSLLEFFVAYRFVSLLNILKSKFIINCDEASLNNFVPTPDSLFDEFGKFSLASPKMSVVHDFILGLVEKDLTSTLWNKFSLLDRVTDNYLASNLLHILTKNVSDFSNKSYANLKMDGLRFYGMNLDNCDFTGTKFKHTTIINCSLNNTSFKNCVFKYDGGSPGMQDINGGNHFDFSRDSSRIVTVGRLFLDSYLTDNNTPAQQIPIDYDAYIQNLVCLNRDLLCTSDYNELTVYNVTTGATIFKEKVHNSYINGIAKDKESIRFATYTDSIYSNEGSEVKIWDINDLSRPKVLNFKQGVFEVCFYNTQNSILVSTRDGSVFFCDLNTEKVSLLFDKKELNEKVHRINPSISNGGSPYIYSLSFNPTDNILAIGSTIGTVAIWDLKANVISRIIDTDGSYVTKTAFSNNGKFLAIDCLYGQVRIISISTWEEIFVISNSNAGFVFSPDSNYLAYGGKHEDSTIFILDLHSLDLINTISRRLDFSTLDITGLIAPLWNILFYIERGAKGWYTKQELIEMSEDKFRKLLKGLQIDKGELPDTREDIANLILNEPGL